MSARPPLVMRPSAPEAPATALADLEIVTERSLEENEKVIQDGLKASWKTRVEVGRCLRAIKEQEQYQRKYGTWECYCQERWNSSKSYCDKLIAWAQVVGNLLEGDNCHLLALPESEGLARPLSKLDSPQKQATAWKNAFKQSGGNPTAKDVIAAVARILPPKRAPEPVVRTFKDVEIPVPKADEPPAPSVESMTAHESDDIKPATQPASTESISGNGELEDPSDSTESMSGDSEPVIATNCYKVDATITILVTRHADARDEEEAIRLVKRLYGQGLERHLKAYQNSENVDILSTTWSAKN